MAVGRGGYATRQTLGFLLYGEQGTWKSSLCLELAKFKREDGKPFRVLYIDAEQGSIDSYLEHYENEGVDLQNIYILYTQSLSEVSEYVRRAKKREPFYEFDENGEETNTVYLDADGEAFNPDVIIVDGITLLYIARQQSYLEFSKKRATVRAKHNELVGIEREVAVSGASIEIKDYNSLKFDGQNIVLDLLASGKHFAVTCREEDEKEQYKDAKGEIKSMATGRKQPAGFKDIRYNVKTVIRLYKDKDGSVKGIVEDKDRTRVHQQYDVLLEPSLMDWQVIIGKNKNKKSLVVDNGLDAAVTRDMKAIESKENKYSEEMERTENDPQEDLNTIDDYYAAISAAMSKVKEPDRPGKLAELQKNGIPKNYRTIKDVDTLSKFLAIVKSK